MDLMGRFYEGKLYWLVAADYERTTAEFNYICEALEKLGWNFEATKRVDPGEIIADGGYRFVTKSAKDPKKLAMEAPDGILACEASQLDYETYLRLRNRLAEKRGWMLMSGTFETSLGWYPEMFLRWQVENQEDGKTFSLPTWSNLAIFPGGENDPEILLQKNSSSADWFSERFGGIPCPPKGRVFTEFSNQIHTGCSGAFELDINSVCYIWIDPGYAHAYAVLVAQKRGDDIYITDEVYENGLVSSDIITICKKQPWWNRVAGGTIDIAAKQHQGMPAVEEIWWKEAGIRLRSNKIRIEDGIERLKTFLKVNPVTGRPSVYINTRCKGLISELGGCPSPITNQEAVYRWKMDKSGIVVGSVPEDKNCDAIKALIYGLIDTCGYSLAQQGKRNIIPVKFF